jgi:hypothetical protein
MKAPLRYPKLTREHVEQFREIERAYHVRAFGEELARVNLDLTKEERIRYLEWMRENARQHGVKVEKPAPYGFSEDEGNADGPPTSPLVDHGPVV